MTQTAVEQKPDCAGKQRDMAKVFGCGDKQQMDRYCSQVPPRGVFVRTLHENPETAGAKMSALCSFCVHHVAVNGEAVNSNDGSCSVK